MKSCRPPSFWKRKFEPQVIVTCVRWYLRFCLSFRDLEELMAERGPAVDHTTIWRWTQTYGRVVYRRLHGEAMRKSSNRQMDETFVRIAGKWMYLFRADDSQGQTVDFYLLEMRDRQAAKLFLKKALSNADNHAPHVCARDGLRRYPAARGNSKPRGESRGAAVSRSGLIATTGSNPITATSSGDCARFRGRERQRQPGRSFRESKRHT
jgi:transposase-like protein